MPEADLPALYSAAAAFVFPSLYEGFGLPVLEAMACGTPVICSNTSSLPEVAGDPAAGSGPSAALLVDPLDAAALADALRLVLTDDGLRAELRRHGLARAARFTWQRPRLRPWPSIDKRHIGWSDAACNVSTRQHPPIGTTMRILHIYKDYPPILGGIENHVQLLAQGQAAAGHDVTVLVTNPAGRRTTVPARRRSVIRAGRLATVASTPLSLALPWRLLRQRPDVVHLHYPYPVGEVSQWLLRRGRVTVLAYHADIVRQASILRVSATAPQVLRGSTRSSSAARRCAAAPTWATTRPSCG